MKNEIGITRHETTRKRMEVKRRRLVVASKQYVTPGMLRISFRSDELEDFESPSPDDHVKIVIPGGPESVDPVMRDFTPRAFNPKEGTLTLDFALHERGPAIDWARNSKLGDGLMIAGPKGSASIPDDFDWYLLVGDETALPSIGRRLESMRKGVRVDVFIVVDDKADKQQLITEAQCHTRWIQKKAGSLDGLTTLQAMLDRYVFPEGDGYIWIAAETRVAGEVYRYLSDERGHPKQWMKAAGYWTRGEAGAI